MIKLNCLKSLTSVVVLGILSAHSVLASPADVTRDLGFFRFGDETFETKLDALPKVANVVSDGGHTPFSDTYWPDGDIGIASRYVDANGRSTPTHTRSDIVLNADRPGLQKLKTMSQAEINSLSPAEKFDIANGDYDYPLTKRVIGGQTGNTKYAYGICHGWSPAASNYSEPQKTTFTNADGIQIPFGASDIKGLIAFYYAWEASQFDEKKTANYSFQKNPTTGYYTMVNKREANRVFFEYGAIGMRNVHDSVNPASMHIVLANLVGRYHRSFEIEANPGNDLWNYPVLGFASDISGGSSVRGHDGAVSKVDVKTDIYFTDETDATHETTNGTLSLAKIATKIDGYDRLNLTQAQSPGGVDSRHVLYTLYLDAAGNIVDGEWKGSGMFSGRDRRNQHIGFLWRASRVPFTGKYDILNKIYQPLESGTNVHLTTYNQ